MPGRVSLETSNKRRGQIRHAQRLMLRSLAKDNKTTLAELKKRPPTMPSEKAAKRDYYVTGPGSRLRVLTPTRTKKGTKKTSKSRDRVRFEAPKVDIPVDMGSASSSIVPEKKGFRLADRFGKIKSIIRGKK